MKISIITISYNSERSIRRAIESVVNQKNVNYVKKNHLFPKLVGTNVFMLTPMR